MNRIEIPKRLLIFLVLFLITICLLLITYKTLIDFETHSCYKGIARVLNVQPNYNDIGEAILSDANEKLVIGMNPTEVLSVFKKYGQVEINRNDLYETNNRYLVLSIKTCVFFQNNFYFHISFVNEDEFSSVRIIYPGE